MNEASVNQQCIAPIIIKHGFNIFLCFPYWQEIGCCWLPSDRSRLGRLRCVYGSQWQSWVILTSSEGSLLSSWSTKSSNGKTKFVCVKAWRRRCNLCRGMTYIVFVINLSKIDSFRWDQKKHENTKVAKSKRKIRVFIEIKGNFLCSYIFTMDNVCVVTFVILITNFFFNTLSSRLFWRRKDGSNFMMYLCCCYVTSGHLNTRLQNQEPGGSISSIKRSQSDCFLRIKLHFANWRQERRAATRTSSNKE